MTTKDDRNSSQINASQTHVHGQTSMTVLFSDIKSYTQMSKSLHASRLKELLDTYLREMNQIVEKYDGTIDKIMGDGILALFKHNDDPSRHASNCLEAGIEMQQAADVLRQEWQKLSGSIDLQIRIGIASGDVVLSNSNSNSQPMGTAIGNVVNLASRLQEKATPGSILISQATYLHVAHDFPCRHVADLELKGFADSYSAYEVLGRSAETANGLSAMGGGMHVSPEQRLSPRQPLSMDIEYTINGENFVHRSVNVSEGGVFIASSEPHSIGTSVTIHSSVPTERGILPIIINGRIIRAPQNEGIGIQFTSIEGAQLETIRYFINSVYGLADLSRTKVTEKDQGVRVDILSPAELLRLNDAIIPINSHDLGCGPATYLSARLLHEFRRTKRYNHEFSCIALRVGNLQTLDNKQSKIAALKLVSQQINRSIRNTDEIFYLNEGVFIVLAPETMANRVKTLSARIVREIHGFLRLEVQDFTGLEVRAGTFSFDGRNAQDHNQILRNALDACH